MGIEAACQCGARFMAEDHLAGKTVQCPTCGKPFQVPGGAETTLVAKCGCGASYKVKSSMVGKRVKCAKCQQPFVVGATTKSAPAAAAAPAPTAPDPFGGAAPDPFAGTAHDPLGLGGMDLGSSAFPAAGASPFGAPATAAYQPAAAAPRRSSGNTKTLLLVLGLGGGGFVALVLLGVVGWFVYQAMSPGYATPDAAYNALVKARKAKDWPKFYDTLTVESQETLVGATLMFGLLSGTRDAEVEGMLKKHGLNPDELRSTHGLTPNNPMAMLGAMNPAKIRSYSSSVKGKRAFFGDFVTIVENKRQANPSGPSLAPGLAENLETATLSDVKIEGDTARGTLSNPQNGHMNFRKVNGGWLVHMLDN